VTPFDQVYTALQHVTDPDTGVRDKTKLALAISFNTTCFHVDSEGLLLDTDFYHPAVSTIAQRLTQPDSVRTWDSQSHNPYLTYTTEDGEYYKLWYEDAQSVADKLTLARMFGITGVSVWRLGVIPDYDDIENYNVWSVLADR
jgi:spore germination protein YaaH